MKIGLFESSNDFDLTNRHIFSSDNIIKFSCYHGIKDLPSEPSYEKIGALNVGSNCLEEASLDKWFNIII